MGTYKTIDDPTAALCADDVGEREHLAAPVCRSISAPVTFSSRGSWPIRLAIVRARSALIGMRLDEASRAIAQLKCLLSNRSTLYSGRYACALSVLEASIHAATDDFSAARRVLMSVAAGIGDIFAATILRYLNWKHGEHEALYAGDTVDYLAAPTGGKAICRILSLCVSAALAFDRLQLAISANLATEALEQARARYGNHSPMSTLPATLLAQVAYEQGRLEEAEALLRPRLSVIRASGLPECVLRASVLLARLSLHRGRYRAALAILRETQALGRARGWPRLVSVATSEYGFALETLRYDRVRGAEIRGQNGKLFVVLSKESRHVSIPSHLLTAMNLGALLPNDRVTFPAVETALHRACLAAFHGFSDDSYQLLIPWLRIGAARGLRMAFLDAGRPLLPLLERLYYPRPSDDPRLSDLRPYIATLLRSTIQSNTERSPPIVYRLLSPRETGILQMIAHGMSNKRIAQSLGITPETVKTHAKSIFVKLATRTRAQAVARAESMGLLYFCELPNVRSDYTCAGAI
jgi:LuxR family transcriptional regulator, maltose regulon positive regulatory protein